MKTVPAFQRLHYIAGIFVAPLILVAAFSGFFYALAPTLEKGVYHDEMTRSDLPAHSLGEQINTARTLYPTLDIKGVQVSDDATTRVLFKDDNLTSASYTHAVFVDPGTLEIKGDLVQYGSSSALPFRTWLSEGHKNLWLGDPGRIYSEMAASWLGPLAITGLGLWWFNRQRTKAAQPTAPRRGTRRLAVKRHSTLGVLAVPGLIFLCISGLTWSLWAGDNISAVRKQLDWMPPKPPTTLSAAPSVASGHDDHSEHADHAEHAGHAEHANHTATGSQEYSGPDFTQADTVLRSARADGLDGILQLTPPAKDSDGWVATQVRQAYKLHNDAVSVNGTTGEIFARTPFSSWPLAAQVTSWIIQLHMGTLFGIFSQVALALLALAILGLVMYGYIMWFKRGRGRSTGALPTPVRWRDIPVAARIVLALCVVGYAIIAPMFGMSLLAFLIIDAIWRLVSSRRDSAVQS